MSTTAAALVAEFADGARIAQIAEQELRQRMTAEIAKLERERAFAFRRTRLIQALAGVTDPDPEIAAAAQRRAISSEIGWTGESDIEKTILDHLAPVARAVWQCTCDMDEVGSAEVMADLQAFEAWFETAHGKSFYALFDQYVSEVPVVDF
ncbi:MAG: hypothetical protein ABL904_25345 [Hyphomicrobiaceae bacterium]